MALLTPLSIVAAVAGLGTAQQDPRFDFQFAVPIANYIQSGPQFVASSQFQVAAASAQVAAQAAPAAVAQDVLAQVAAPPQKTVTASFHAARVGEVLDWLQKEGVSFVVMESDIRDKTISVNVIDRPVDEVIDAIGSALGGHWQRQGEIRVFQKSPFAFFPESLGAKTVPGTEYFYRAPSASTQPFAFGNGFDTDKVAKDFAKSFDAEKFAKDFQKSFDAEKFAKTFSQNLAKELAQELRNQQNADLFTHRVEIRTDKSSDKALRTKVFDLNKLNNDSTRFFMAPDANLVYTSRQDLEGLSKSLTQFQKDLMAKQGYLKVTDLNAKQKRMLGMNFKGRFEIRYTKDNSNELIIKGDD